MHAHSKAQQDSNSYVYTCTVTQKRHAITVNNPIINSDETTCEGNCNEGEQGPDQQTRTHTSTHTSTRIGTHTDTTGTTRGTTRRTRTGVTRTHSHMDTHRTHTGTLTRTRREEQSIQHRVRCTTCQDTQPQKRYVDCQECLGTHI